MGDEDEVRLEITDDVVVVEMDGIRSEVRGREAVSGVKRIVASQLLHAIASVPSVKEMHRNRERAMAERQNYARGQCLDYQADVLAGAIASPQADLARAIRHSNAY